MTSALATARLAFRSVLRGGLRSVLTALGVLIGVAAVVTVVALGRGARERVGGQLETLGSNVVYLFNRPIPDSGARGVGASYAGITEDDAEAIRRDASAIAAVTVFAHTSRQVVTSHDNAQTDIVGTDRYYTEVRAYAIERGRTWSAAEERLKAKVCVLGATAAEKLFGSADPVGRFVRIGPHPFRVLGVLSRKGQSPFGGDQDDRIVMPIGSWRARVAPTPGRRVHYIMMAARHADATDQAVDQVDAIMRQRHRIADGDEADFRVRSQQEFRETQDRVIGILSLLLVSVAAIALFIGGVGVMNIMLVNVTERRREIGIRMAIGARPADVQLEFLVEAVTLTLGGGALGVALAFAAILGLRDQLGWPMALGVDAVAAALVTSLTVGLLFGFLPARRAAQLEPMEALRHE